MRDALLLATFTYASVLDVASIDWSENISVNRVFLEKGYLFRACEVRANVLVAAKVAA